jgi:hypothetical protein
METNLEVNYYEMSLLFSRCVVGTNRTYGSLGKLFKISMGKKKY